MAGKTLPVLFTLSAVFIVVTIGAQSDRVLLRDISAITLRHGMPTSARRSPSVPQIKCVGGSAGCRAFVPQVVQCQNRGFDGYDVQWECKTDMDNAYRFGQVEVSCEGYDYPDDPYVLRGSCGLEYTLDLTKEGHQQKHHHGNQHNYYGDDYHDRSSNYYSHKTKHSSFGGVIGLVAAGFVIYMIYKMCLAPPTNTPGARPDQPPPYTPHDTNQAPPPGFKPEFTSGAGYGNAGNTGSYSNTGGYANTGTYANRGGYAGTSTNTEAGNGFGGFWTGMGAGGLLGYLFGSSNSGYGNRGYAHHRHHNTGSFWGNGAGGWGGGGWGGGGWGGGSGFSSGWSSGRSSGGSYSGGSSSGTSSSGTRTASGFGGTRRR